MADEHWWSLCATSDLGVAAARVGGCGAAAQVPGREGHDGQDGRRAAIIAAAAAAGEGETVLCGRGPV